MKTKTVYISIPITGKRESTQRKKALKFQRKFEKMGFLVVNPFEIGDNLAKAYINISGRTPTYKEYMKEDLANLEWCSHIFLCDGWTESNGCMDEVDQSIRDGLTFLFESNYKF